MRILVPLDGSLLAEQALEPATRLAQQVQEPVTVTLLRVDPYLHIVADVTETFSAVATEGLVDQAPEYQAYVAAVRQRELLQQVACDSAVVPGDPATVICSFGQQHQIDLIVMASHIVTSLESAAWGSVAEKVARQSGIPTLIMRPDSTLSPPGDFDKAFTVLVPLDGTPFAEAGVTAALPIVRAFGGQVRLLHVLAVGHETAAAQEKREERAQAYLATIANRAAYHDIPITYDAVWGDPLHEIVAEALRHHATLIAMATHGQSGWERVIGEEHAESIFHHVKIPMLIVRPEMARLIIDALPLTRFSANDR